MRKLDPRVVVKIRRLLRRALRRARNLCPAFLLVKSFYGTQPLAVVCCLQAGRKNQQRQNVEDRKFHSSWFGTARSVQLSVPCHTFSNSDRSIGRSLPRSGSFTRTAASCGSTPT